jgi:hypothetical protein
MPLPCVASSRSAEPYTLTRKDVDANPVQKAGLARTHHRCVMNVSLEA